MFPPLPPKSITDMSDSYIHIHTKKNFKIGSPDTEFIWKYAYFLIFLNITTGKETRPDLHYFTFSCGILHFPLPLPLRLTLSLCLMFVHNLFLALPRYIHRRRHCLVRLVRYRYFWFWPHQSTSRSNLNFDHIAYPLWKLPGLKQTGRKSN